jgi:hypothetical protein
MKQETLFLILGLSPLVIGGIIAAVNSLAVNNSTEKIEAWARKQQSSAATKKGWLSRYIINPILWLLVKFFNWTDSFTHRGIKNGVRVAATLYLIAAWCFLLYLAFMVALVVVISGVIIYIFYKVVFTMLLNSNPDFKKGYNASKKIFGPVGDNKRINQETGMIQEKGMFGWSDTNQKIDRETGHIQEKGMFGWDDTKTKVDQETGVIQKKEFWGYDDTDTRINPETGVIQKKGLIGWDDTDERVEPETGKHQKKGLLGWDDV